MTCVGRQNMLSPLKSGVACHMQITITAVGPDNVRLVDPIIHYVTGEGANIAEVQMYDHDEEALFAMLLRIDLPVDRFAEFAERHA